MNVIKKMLAKQHRCSESDIKILNPKTLSETTITTQIDVEYEIKGKKHVKKVILTPPIIVK